MRCCHVRNGKGMRLFKYFHHPTKDTLVIARNESVFRNDGENLSIRVPFHNIIYQNKTKQQ